jgi:hypothetical protein
MDTRVTVTYQELSRQARPYPAFLLDRCHTGLALFAAGFHGWNDAIHFARAGMRGDCVDIDGKRLNEMRAAYPDDWGFTCADAWQYAEQARAAGVSWDAVSVDTFTGGAMRRALDSLPLWCAIANRVVTVTYVKPNEYIVPDGWREGLYPRSDTVDWLVLTP